MSAPPTIRARRYVSAPAGSYPPARREGRRRPVPSAEPVGFSVEDFDHEDRGPEPMLMVAADDPMPSERIVAEPPPSERASDDLHAPLSVAALPESEVGARRGGDSSRGIRPLVILSSGLVGVLLGALAGLALLAYMEPARWMERFLDPVGLWNSADDPLIRASAIMIVVGCGLIGALLPLRLRN